MGITYDAKGLNCPGQVFTTEKTLEAFQRQSQANQDKCCNDQKEGDDIQKWCNRELVYYADHHADSRDDYGSPKCGFCW
jgi:hypothetical protein